MWIYIYIFVVTPNEVSETECKNIGIERERRRGEETGVKLCDNYESPYTWKSPCYDSYGSYTFNPKNYESTQQSVYMYLTFYARHCHCGNQKN